MIIFKAIEENVDNASNKQSISNVQNTAPNGLPLLNSVRINVESGNMSSFAKDKITHVVIINDENPLNIIHITLQAATIKDK